VGGDGGGGWKGVCWEEGGKGRQWAVGKGGEAVPGVGVRGGVGGGGVESRVRKFNRMGVARKEGGWDGFGVRGGGSLTKVVVEGGGQRRELGSM